MLLSKLKVLKSHGKQFIPDLSDVELCERFRGLPVLTNDTDVSLIKACVETCPSGAFQYDGKNISLDLGRCLFCNECAHINPDCVRFTNQWRIASNKRENLLITTSSDKVEFNDADTRAEVVKYFGRALKLRSVCAGGDNSNEMELGAVMNVNFDFGRYGIEFVASPRHADGIVITGPITKAMAEPLEICYQAIASPKLIIVVGTDAISGGLFADSPMVDRSFFKDHTPDLYVPGNPAHPLTFIDGVLTMLKKRVR